MVLNSATTIKTGLKMERLKRMAIFARVVECGSFTGAAAQLAMSVSSISQTITKLERALQIRLLNRSTRRISLTEAGRIYYQGCRKMLQEAQEVHEQLYAYNNTPAAPCASAARPPWRKTFWRRSAPGCWPNIPGCRSTWSPASRRPT
ncbi:LysR family transcriptional regulator [Edwardsiella anguillarum]|nr:LysR family transcriptional regulator [Edwardsiella anguillarum]